jgi:protein-disulfide isomerase
MHRHKLFMHKEFAMRSTKLNLAPRTSTSALVVVLLLGVGWLVQSNVAAAPLTEEQGDAILGELQQIRQVLEKMQQQGVVQAARAPSAAQNTRARISTSNRPFLGAEDAPVTLVEFTDYQCPYCSRFFSTTLTSLKKEYIDTGKVRLVIKDLPLSMHPNARPAAVAAHCANDQERFWAMHDSMFKNSRKLQTEHLAQYAQDIGLDTERFQECIGSDRHNSMIQADISEASRQGISGTPTFIVGRTTDDVVEGVKLRGAQSVETFRSHIDELLKQTDEPSG